MEWARLAMAPPTLPRRRRRSAGCSSGWRSCKSKQRDTRWRSCALPFLRAFEHVALERLDGVLDCLADQPAVFIRDGVHFAVDRRHDAAIELGRAAGPVIARLALGCVGGGRLARRFGGRRPALAARETGGFGDGLHLFRRRFQFPGFLLGLEGAEIEIAGIPENAQTFLGHHATSARAVSAASSLNRLTTSTMNFLAFAAAAGTFLTWS